MIKDDVKHLNHNVKKLSSINGTKEKLLLSSPMVTMSDKRTKISKSKPIRNNDVYDLLLKIPAGKVSTYGDLARALGNPSASRAIGRILGENPNPIKVPCHRVVMSNGQIGGYAYGTARKRQLLEKEGVSLTNGIVQNFKNVRVYPQSSKD
ncbi:MAG: MGMT family protein [Nitrososphaeraceae archaeon]|jgi:methylated-DNA-[protein]-cysteine S-methyltransferase